MQRPHSSSNLIFRQVSRKHPVNLTDLSARHKVRVSRDTFVRVVSMRSGKYLTTTAAHMKRLCQGCLITGLALVLLLQQSPFTIAICHHSLIPSFFLITATVSAGENHRIACPYCRAQERSETPSRCPHCSAPVDSDDTLVGGSTSKTSPTPCCTIVTKSPVDSCTSNDNIVHQNSVSWVAPDLSYVITLTQIVARCHASPNESPRVFNRVIAFSHFLI